MRGIADKRDSAFAPAAQGRAMEQPPARAYRYRLDHLRDGRMPLLEACQLIALVCGNRPFTCRPWRRMTLDQEEVLIAVAYGIVQQMAARSHPELDGVPVRQLVEKLRCDDAAKRRAARVQPVVIPKHPLPHRRTRAVAAD